MNALVQALVGLPPWLVLTLVFVLPALEASAFVGLVVPGEIVVLIGGVVAHGGGLALWWVILAATAGAAVGDQIGYLLGRRYGQALLERLPSRVRRSGAVDRARDLVRRRGAIAVLVGRWAAALRALVPGIAGLSGVGRGVFTVANLVSGSIWAAVIATAGYAAGASYRALEQRLGVAGDVLLAVVLAAAAAWGLYQRRRGRARGEGL